MIDYDIINRDCTGLVYEWARVRIYQFYREWNFTNLNYMNKIQVLQKKVKVFWNHLNNNFMQIILCFLKTLWYRFHWILILSWIFTQFSIDKYFMESSMCCTFHSTRLKPNKMPSWLCTQQKHSTCRGYIVSWQQDT